MTTFYLIRHGDKQRANLIVGRMPGVHLTAKGRAQALQMASQLRRASIRRIVSSPLERTIETATPLARAKRLEIETSAAFHEVDVGAWTGKQMKALQASPAWKEFCAFPGGTAIPDGETLAEVQARVVSEMIRLRARHRDEGVAIVTHEDPIRLAICHFIGAPIDVYEHITIRLGSVTVLKIDRELAILERLDEIAAPRARKQ